VSKSIADLQAELPRTIKLAKYWPVRNNIKISDLNPSHVHCVDDLPDYLILGCLDHNQCEFSGTGWRAKWQGLESDTFFEVKYFAAQERYEIRQMWCGVDGGLSSYPSKIPLITTILQTMYATFPSNWDQEAKTTLENAFQLRYQELIEGIHYFCGVPDGAFRTIAFPVNVKGLRGVRRWLEGIAASAEPIYPFSAEAKLIFQAVNYIEGKAPEWTQSESVLFGQSLTSTGLAPLEFPVREVADNGSAAWTLRREIYYVFIKVPFAGLSHFLQLLSSPEGPVRGHTDELLPGELQPIVMESSLDVQVESIVITDIGKTTRTSLFFDKSRETQSAKDVKNLEQFADDHLNAAENLSAAVVSAFEQILDQ
jgi:hypothetical protein